MDGRALLLNGGAERLGGNSIYRHINPDILRYLFIRTTLAYRDGYASHVKRTRTFHAARRN